MDRVFLANHIEFSLVECGKEKCIPHKKFVFTPKKQHIIHFVVSGKGSFIENRDGEKIRHDLRRAELFYIPPNSTAEYYPDEAEPWTYVWVVFDGVKAKQWLTACNISEENPVVHYGKKSGINELAEQLYEATSSANEPNLKCLGLMYILFQELYENTREKEETTLTVKQVHVLQARNFIINNYDQPISVTDIASSLNLTPNYLTNIFTDALKISPKQYLTQYRIDVAKHLLETGQYKVKQVGEHIGYKNQLHFSSEFKKIVGVSPLNYVKEVQEPQQG